MNPESKFVPSQGPPALQQWIILPGTTVGGPVGTFNVDFTIWNRSKTESRTLTGLVDTGASYTLIPASILDALGIERIESNTFRLADGSTRELAIGLLEMDLEGHTRVVYVVFGADDQRVLLGAMALEAFALAADATRRRLIPAELTL